MAVTLEKPRPKPRARPVTHYVPYDARGPIVTAICGAQVRLDEHAAWPSCPTCRQMLDGERE